MNRNIKIAKELVRIARMMIAGGMNPFASEYIASVKQYIDECFNMNYVVGSFDIKYNVRYDTADRNFKLTIIQGAHNVPSTENVDETQIKEWYNSAVQEVKENFYNIDGYHEIEQNCSESLENSRMLHNEEFQVYDDKGDLVDFTDEFKSEVSEDAKKLAFEIINRDCLVDVASVCIKFFNADGTDSGIRQELDPDGFNTCE